MSKLALKIVINDTFIIDTDTTKKLEDYKSQISKLTSFSLDSYSLKNLKLGTIKWDTPIQNLMVFPTVHFVHLLR